MKNTPKKLSGDKWDDRQLGASEVHARRVDAKREAEVDDRLGMQTISIRLQKKLIDDLKQLATDDGIGYQPYIRQLLTRHVKQIKREHLKSEKVK